MKSNAIVNRICCCLIIILSVFNSNAQPDYLSREYAKWPMFYRIISYDSGYFVSKSPRIVKLNFSGDTILNRVISFSKPGNHFFTLYKGLQNKLYCIGYDKSTTVFVAKLNYSLDTLWVKYYDTVSYDYTESTVINDTLIITYLDTGLKINVLIVDNNGALIEHRIHPKYPGSLDALIHNVAAVNTKVFAIALEIFYKSSWDQNYYRKPIICVSDTNGYNYFESGFAYLSGSGTSQSFIFYDTVSNRIKHIYHFAQMDNYVKLYEHSLSGQLMASKGIYWAEASVTGESWWPLDIIMLENGCFVIAGVWDKIWQNNTGSFLMRCGPHGEWSWFRKYHDEQTSGDHGVLYSCTETYNHFLACAGTKTKAWLLVVDSLGCEAPGVCWVGQEEISAPLQETQLEVFPNPAGDEVWVKSHCHFAGIEIYAMNGQKMPLPALSAENPLRIDTRAWPAGLYMVRARLQSDRVLTQKFVKLRNP
ncbi:MAG: Secretion system C-terminal sorting domain [Bacteroidales bacterium]|nr:Secretion system C-terminal sorting domain [Bacteroidales bacterium]